MRISVILLVALVACGRSGFDELPPPPPLDSAPDAMPPVLSCSTVPRFELGGTTAQLSASATLQGYSVVSVDDTGQVRGFSYQFSPGDPAHATLAEGVSALAVAPNATGPLDVFAAGDDLLLVMPYGRPNPTGTTLVPLDARLGPRGPVVMHDGWYAAGGALARSTSGAIAFLSQKLSNGEVDAQLVSSTGANATLSSVPVIVPGGGNNPTILPAGDKFLVVWNAPASPNEVRAQLFDDQLIPRTQATKISFDKTFGSISPRAAYAAGADRYLFAWSQKVASGADEVWLSLRDGSLQETVAPIRISSQGVVPAIIAGDDSFLVAWQDGGSQYKLGAARIAKDGTATPLGVPGTGKTAAWDLVVRYGQPALVWIETGGVGPNLWLDPLCN